MIFDLHAPIRLSFGSISVYNGIRADNVISSTTNIDLYLLDLRHI